MHASWLVAVLAPAYQSIKVPSVYLNDEVMLWTNVTHILVKLPGSKKVNLKVLNEIVSLHHRVIVFLDLNQFSAQRHKLPTYLTHMKPACSVPTGGAKSS